MKLPIKLVGGGSELFTLPAYKVIPPEVEALMLRFVNPPPDDGAIASQSKDIICPLVTGIVTLLVTVVLLYENICVVPPETLPIPLASGSFLTKLTIKL